MRLFNKTYLIFYHRQVIRDGRKSESDEMNTKINFKHIILMLKKTVCEVVKHWRVKEEFVHVHLLTALKLWGWKWLWKTLISVVSILKCILLEHSVDGVKRDGVLRHLNVFNNNLHSFVNEEAKMCIYSNMKSFKNQQSTRLNLKLLTNSSHIAFVIAWRRVCDVSSYIHSAL